MANEIWTDNFLSGSNLDAYIRKKTDDKVFDESDGGDTFETWVNGNVANYDIPMTDQGGDYYTVDFPTVITTAGIYRVVIALRVGGTAAIGDRRIAQGELYWDGSAEIDLFTLDASINDDIIGEDGNTLESLSDQMDVLSAQGSRVLNRYPTRSNPDV